MDFPSGKSSMVATVNSPSDSRGMDQIVVKPSVREDGKEIWRVEHLRLRRLYEPSPSRASTSSPVMK